MRRCLLGPLGDYAFCFEGISIKFRESILRSVNLSNDVPILLLRSGVFDAVSQIALKKIVDQIRVKVMVEGIESLKDQTKSLGGSFFSQINLVP